jgi:hypothetical protein
MEKDYESFNKFAQTLNKERLAQKEAFKLKKMNKKNQ